MNDYLLLQIIDIRSVSALVHNTHGKIVVRGDDGADLDSGMGRSDQYHIHKNQSINQSFLE